MWWDLVNEWIVGAPAKFGLVYCEYVEVMSVLEWILISGLSPLCGEGVFVPGGKGEILHQDY